MVTKKAQKWLWMNRENMWLEWVLARPAGNGMASHAAMHEEVVGLVPLLGPQVCADCGGERKAGAGGWGEVQLCGKCHREAPGLREVLQLKCVIVLAEVARQLWGSKGHKIARSLAVW